MCVQTEICLERHCDIKKQACVARRQIIRHSFVMRDASSEINKIKAYGLTLECQEHKNT